MCTYTGEHSGLGPGPAEFMFRCDQSDFSNAGMTSNTSHQGFDFERFKYDDIPHSWDIICFLLSCPSAVSIDPFIIFLYKTRRYFDIQSEE